MVDAARTARENGSGHRAPFEKPRGVTSVTIQGNYAHLTVSIRPDQPRAVQEMAVFDGLVQHAISINLVKLHRGGLSFVVDAGDAARTLDALKSSGFTAEVKPHVSMVSVHAGNMRGLSGVMARIAGALLRADIPMLQSGDAPDAVFCLVPAEQGQRAVQALADEFQVPARPQKIVVQKFGGRSVGTAEARKLAAERVKEAIDEGYRPVVVVSAIGRMGEPYATDTLLSHLDAVDPEAEAAPRERDMLMACGEIISTVIMAQTLKTLGVRAVALTGGQAGILTDYRYGDAQILDIDPTCIEKFLFEDGMNAVVVAGFQGVTEQGAITTLGRGGSDTTASALGAALGADKIEIYTHVDGVMTADPEVVPGAHTLPVVTYEEVCNMAHQGAKVLHPRAAEIAMLHQIPLWVKTSFERARGTLIAPLAEIQPPQVRGVTGVATLSRLVYFTLTELPREGRASIEYRVFEAVGEAGVNFYLNSEGPDTTSFIVEQAFARKTEAVLKELGLRYELTENCEMVSVVALNMWEEPGFLRDIARALADEGVPVLQMADSEGSVSCLVRRDDGPRAVRALHGKFGLGQ
jgi:aspartate kinase